MESAEISQFEKDLEFIQLICNPDYIKWLFDNNYFYDGKFIKYLNYLKYFNELKFKIFLFYPQATEILEILLSEDNNNNNKDGNKDGNIIIKLRDDKFYKNLRDRQYFLWKGRK